MAGRFVSVLALVLCVLLPVNAAPHKAAPRLNLVPLIESLDRDVHLERVAGMSGNSVGMSPDETLALARGMGAPRVVIEPALPSWGMVWDASPGIIRLNDGIVPQLTRSMTAALIAHEWIHVLINAHGSDGLDNALMQEGISRELAASTERDVIQESAASCADIWHAPAYRSAPCSLAQTLELAEWVNDLPDAPPALLSLITSRWVGPDGPMTLPDLRNMYERATCGADVSFDAPPISLERWDRTGPWVTSACASYVRQQL